MAYKIGVDVGGTFTDLAAVDDKGNLCLTKTPSTPGQEARGTMEGLRKVAAHYGRSLGDLLANSDVIVHGTTVATNTMLQFNGAVTALLTTKGFRDEIEIRRGIKESMYNVKLDKPHPIVLRRRRLGVVERLDYTGAVVTRLDEDSALDAIRQLKAMGTESFALCFLFSYLNPVHEERVAQLVREECPGAYVSISSEILPQVREFERGSTTLVNAYVGPKLEAYLEALSQELRQGGYRGDLYVMQSNGGVASAKICGRRSVYALYSGPAGGVAGAVHMGERLGFRDVITVDMGGTSYDVCLIKDGRPVTGTENWVSRYRVAVPMIDIHSIGAGGGSIAWVDSGDALQVGPRSAGAMPGPACYGRGGAEPTVTDADLVLGYLAPEAFAGGEIRLDRSLAEESIASRVAKPLGLDLVEAAYAIFRIVNANMANGIRVVSVQRGFDPRDFALMAFGGAGAVHAGVQAQDLNIPRIIVPRAAPMFCALGDLVADVRVTEVRSFVSQLEESSMDPMGRLLAEMGERAKSQLPQSGLLGVEVERFADMRYAGEVHEVTVQIQWPGDRLAAAAMESLAEDFHRAHERLYAYRDLHSPVQVLNLRVDAIGRVWKPELPAQPLAGSEASGALKGSRRAYFPEAGGFVETPVYEGPRLRPGNVMRGPCVIEELWTTIVVQPTHTASLDSHGNYLIDVPLDRGGQ